jgi:hypothetical protein
LTDAEDHEPFFNSIEPKPTFRLISADLWQGNAVQSTAFGQRMTIGCGRRFNFCGPARLGLA